MPISTEIRPLLPFLRRFSRAVNGNMASGDAYVVATLERLLVDPLAFPRDLPPRMALYQVFLDVWSASPVRGDFLDPAQASTVDRKLAALSPQTRQAFLLHTVEGFSISEVATIMGLDRSRVNRLLERGAEEIGRELAATVMIIEDEPIIAMDLETIVQDLGHEVVGIVRTRRQAVALAAECEPELIVADIQLADGSSGIEAVNEIVGKHSKPVVFVTAHPAVYLGSAENRPEPVFLLSKPFSPDSVRAAVSQALFFDRRARAAA
jgi:DNA-directed RNA polymerase specialized sigma24 family protein/CheY-like chemotaxis protein